ncbi:hypothetical protein LTR66_005094 [Elasticomyces elasticus]|nr:hypothetical protein LTR66_005094 [Elasticomyces elasticus]
MSETRVLAAAVVSTTTALLTSGAILSVSLFEIPKPPLDTPNLLSTPQTSSRHPKPPLDTPTLLSTPHHDLSAPAPRALLPRLLTSCPRPPASSLAIYAWAGPTTPDRAGHFDQRNGYVAAAVGVGSIMPSTTLVMLPAANGRLIELEENRKRRGGEEREEKELLRGFWWMNTVRGLLMGVGGVVGMWTAMTR